MTPPSLLRCRHKSQVEDAMAEAIDTFVDVCSSSVVEDAGPQAVPNGGWNSAERSMYGKVRR